LGMVDHSTGEGVATPFIFHFFIFYFLIIFRGNLDS